MWQGRIWDVREKKGDIVIAIPNESHQYATVNVAYAVKLTAFKHFSTK